jgi:hypothetical protein
MQDDPVVFKFWLQLRIDVSVDLRKAPPKNIGRKNRIILPNRGLEKLGSITPKWIMMGERHGVSPLLMLELGTRVSGLCCENEMPEAVGVVK